MNCKHCNKPIILVPSASERAAKDVTGKSAKYCESLFEYHSECQLYLRDGGMDPKQKPSR